jgi:predicted XRE-type DNA-binding protein
MKVHWTDTAVVNSSANVFIDPGYSPDEAAILQMRADLMADLRKFIKAKKLTQANAAEIVGVSQSGVSDLIRGKWEKFSLEMLITLATRAGMRVTLKKAARGRGNNLIQRMRLTSR